MTLAADATGRQVSRDEERDRGAGDARRDLLRSLGADDIVVMVGGAGTAAAGQRFSLPV
jgi:hypothetical protein